MDVRSALKAATPRRYRQRVRAAGLRAAAVWYRGSRVRCPCCGRSFRKLAPFAGRNDQCPGCGSLMRHRLLFLHLEERLRDPAKTVRVLHFAPEPALQEWLRRAPRVDYVSSDLDSPLASVHADITSLPFEDRSYELIVCSHVLEHVPDDRAAIAELLRVLVPGGVAIVQVPVLGSVTFEDPAVTDPGERARVFGQFDHVRRCGPEYYDRLAEGGFEVDVVDLAEPLDPATRERYVVRTGEPFAFATRPAGA